MKVLVFDTETTGLITRVIKNGKCVKKYPYMLQLAWILYDVAKNNLVASHDHIIKLPEGVNIPKESITFHGITQDIMEKNGENINDVLSSFVIHLNSADYVVAHNISFDMSIISKEFSRNGMINHFDVLSSKKIFYCTMKESEELCNLMVPDLVNGGTRRKYPKLEELHYILFKQKLKNLHNAYNDILVCFRCFYKMMYDRDIVRMDHQIQKNFRTYFDIKEKLYSSH